MDRSSRKEAAGVFATRLDTTRPDFVSRDKTSRSASLPKRPLAAVKARIATDFESRAALAKSTTRSGWPLKYGAGRIIFAMRGVP